MIIMNNIVAMTFLSFRILYIIVRTITNFLYTKIKFIMVVTISHHPLPPLQVLWVLDKAEPHESLVAGAQAIARHR